MIDKDIRDIVYFNYDMVFDVEMDVFFLKFKV